MAATWLFGHSCALETPEGRFHLSREKVSSKNPSEKTIVKAVQRASALDARVEGDDGEFYNADGSCDSLQVEQPERSLWSKIFGG